MAEYNQEVLECSRYGEHEELKELFAAGADVNFTDSAGNTGLHKAAANGELLCLHVLKEYGANFKHNENGNLPTHWAAANGKVEALKFLLDNYNVDVLSQNSFGRSTLTEAFQSGNTDVIEMCLSHTSANEEKLLDIKSGSSNVGQSHCQDLSDKKQFDNENEKHAVYHNFFIDSTRTIPDSMDVIDSTVLKIRELPIRRADNPFGNDAAPEEGISTSDDVFCNNL